VSRLRTDTPAASTIRSRRSRELEALGYVTDRATYLADALRLLVAAGYISERMATACGRQAREARSQALTDFLAVALSVLEAELMQPAANPMSVTGYSLRRRRE
jgi:hypothetical protein